MGGVPCIGFFAKIGFMSSVVRSSELLKHQSRGDVLKIARHFSGG